ncbi:MAG: type II toxin-antitoxin system HicA family toxin [Phycisphaeraceae bacterium]|nr:type II toxin-antitoxin system HicA family toxin [Phycisphaeraceae bacterium]
MSGLPVISGRQAVAELERVGYEVVRQRGSHLRLRHPTDASRQPVTVPDHKELKSGTLRAIIRDAGMSVEEFRLLVR